jgi:hypothetical protein
LERALIFVKAGRATAFASSLELLRIQAGTNLPFPKDKPLFYNVPSGSGHGLSRDRSPCRA